MTRCHDLCGTGTHFHPVARVTPIEPVSRILIGTDAFLKYVQVNLSVTVSAARLRPHHLCQSADDGEKLPRAFIKKKLNMRAGVDGREATTVSLTSV